MSTLDAPYTKPWTEESPSQASKITKPKKVPRRVSSCSGSQYYNGGSQGNIPTGIFCFLALAVCKGCSETPTPLTPVQERWRRIERKESEGGVDRPEHRKLKFLMFQPDLWTLRSRKESFDSFRSILLHRS